MTPITFLWIAFAAFFAFFGIAQIVFLNSKNPATVLRAFFFTTSAVLVACFIDLAVKANL